MKTLEVIYIVNDLNLSIGEENYSPFKLTICSQHDILVEFMGIPIWSNDLDEREEIDDVKEPLRNFLIRESFKILNNLNVKMKVFKP